MAIPERPEITLQDGNDGGLAGDADGALGREAARLLADEPVEARPQLQRQLAQGAMTRGGGHALSAPSGGR
jgi:hypothetical protein